jgi:hypothetical protein
MKNQLQQYEKQCWGDRKRTARADVEPMLQNWYSQYNNISAMYGLVAREQ